MRELKLQIPSIQENIRIVESFIDNAKEKYNISDDLYGNIMVSVTEAVANAIIHGNKNNSALSVTLALELHETKAVFRITDCGVGFDYDNLPDPTAPENLEKVGGRGIFLMRNLADEVNFIENGKTIELTFNV